MLSTHNKLVLKIVYQHLIEQLYKNINDEIQLASNNIPTIN